MKDRRIIDFSRIKISKFEIGKGYYKIERTNYEVKVKEGNKVWLMMDVLMIL